MDWPIMSVCTNDSLTFNLLNYNGATNIKYGDEFIYQEGVSKNSSLTGLNVNDSGDLSTGEPGNFTESCFYYLRDNLQNYNWTKISDQDGNYTCLSGSGDDDKVCNKNYLVMTYDWAVILAIVVAVLAFSCIMIYTKKWQKAKKTSKGAKRVIHSTHV